jgi:hypothetical protein
LFYIFVLEILDEGEDHEKIGTREKIVSWSHFSYEKVDFGIDEFLLTTGVSFTCFLAFISLKK